MLIDFTGRGRVWGKEAEEHRCQRETNIDQLPLIHAPTRDQTHNLGTCPDQGSNP